MIHKSAIIHPSAEIGSDVSIGPYSVIGEKVHIDSGNIIGSHVVIDGPTKIGENNKLYQYCSIGADPQDKKFHGESNSILEIGCNNVFREFVSINRGTENGGGKTIMGDNNWIMAYVHVAHDCIIGNDIVLANNATLAGHVTIDDYVILGGFTAIHQFCRIGSYSFSAGHSFITKDVPPYLFVSGNTAKPYGLNREGLKRHNFDNDVIKLLRKSYKIMYRNGLSLKDSLSELKIMSTDSKEVENLYSFIVRSKRGIVK